MIITRARAKGCSLSANESERTAHFSAHLPARARQVPKRERRVMFRHKPKPRRTEGSAFCPTKCDSCDYNPHRRCACSPHPPRDAKAAKGRGRSGQRPARFIARSNRNRSAPISMGKRTRRAKPRGDRDDASIEEEACGESSSGIARYARKCRRKLCEVFGGVGCERHRKLRACYKTTILDRSHTLASSTRNLACGAKLRVSGSPCGERWGSR